MASRWPAVFCAAAFLFGCSLLGDESAKKASTAAPQEKAPEIAAATPAVPTLAAAKQEELAKKPAEQPVKKEEPAKKEPEKVAEKATEKSTEKPTEKPSEKPAVRPSYMPPEKDATGKTPSPVIGPFKTFTESASYAMGMRIGRSMKEAKFDIDLQSVMKGLEDALAGSSSLLNESELTAVMAEMQRVQSEKHEAQLKADSERNKKEGDAFRAEYAERPGVQKAPNGVLYRVLQEGTGPKPKLTDRMTVHYRGTLVNGTEFDSSYRRNAPYKRKLTETIKGWQEALQLMPVGSKWEICIPPELAYKESGSGSLIGPGATLVFEVELISIP